MVGKLASLYAEYSALLMVVEKGRQKETYSGGWLE